MANIVLTFALYHHGSFQRRETLAQAIVKIGKDANSHLCLPEPNAARMQAVIEVTGEHAITLIDLGNEPGTRVNGALVNKATLAVGDRIEVGASRIVLESVEARADDPFAARPAVAALDPFAFARPSPATAEFGFALLKSGPAVNADEVELPHVQAVEVMVLWGDNVLSVSHLTPPRDFHVGEEESAHIGCDFFVPSEQLGATRMPLVLADATRAALVIPAAARGFVELPGGTRRPLSEVRATATPSAHANGAHECALPGGAKARLELGGFVFQIAVVNAGKPLQRGMTAAWDWNLAAYFGLSFVSHASILAAMAFFMPSLNGITDDELDRDRLYTMQQYLDSASEREREKQASQAEAPKAEQEGGTGTQAKAEEGAMGNPSSRAANKRYQVAGPRDNPDAHLARASALRDASEFGIISLLAGDPNAPTAPWGRDTALGTDEVSARGNMWGDELGEAFGSGLGLTGIGEGGGRRGEGVGMGDIGTLGRGRGRGTGDGFGNGDGFGTSRGLPRGVHVARAPRVAVGVTTVSGRLPPEVIQRVVRQNFGRFRLCYQAGLGRNPNLEGRVSARFVIGRDGAVSAVGNGGSDLPDSAVTSCVLSAFYGLSFPQPAGGIVTVTYPIMLAPG